MLSKGRGLTSAAVAYARKTFGHSDEHVAGTDELAPGGAVGEAPSKSKKFCAAPRLPG